MKPFEIKKILIPTDFSVLSLEAIDPAINMAKLTNAEITLVHVIYITPSTAPSFYFPIMGSPGYENNLKDMSYQHLNELAETIRKSGVAVADIFAVTGLIYPEIITLSKKMKADIIIMGTHGISGFNEYFMGSNTFRVVSHADCPVLSVRKSNAEFKSIVVPFQDKPHSREKIENAIVLAKIYGATIHVLGVDTEGGGAHAKKMMLEAAQIKKIVEGHGVSCELKVITGDYLADTVLDYAEKMKADLIIITADMDKVSISEYFMGPFAQQIINHSKTPVLSIHPKFNTDTIDLRFY